MEWLRNKITQDTAINYEWPSWTPDGNKIMSNCHFADGQKRICVLNLLDGEEELLGNGTVSGDQPKWSPKGYLIALERGTSVFVY